MAGRIRTIKPEMLEDVRTAELSDGAFRLFIGALLLADDEGRLRADVRYLTGQVFWGAPEDSTCSRDQVARARRELVEASILVLYTVRGQEYGLLRTFKKHQKIDRPSGPKCPGPDEADSPAAPPEPPQNPPPVPPADQSNGALVEPSSSPQGGLAPRASGSGKDLEGNGTGREGSGEGEGSEPEPADPRATGRPDQPPPEPGTRPRALFEFLRTDPQLSSIVPRPSELAHRLADADAFPALDPLAECKRAAAWLAANPKNRKKDGARFLTSWFSRAQERAPRVDRPLLRGMAPPPRTNAAPSPEAQERQAALLASVPGARVSRTEGGIESVVVDAAALVEATEQRRRSACNR